MTIWTIGHSTRGIEEFIDLLRGCNIEALADVRRYPGSRRYPHFSREALERSLPAHGIEYHHFPDLGGRRAPRPDSRNTTWRHEAFRGYADYMETPEFQAAAERLAALAGLKRTAIMCSEAVWWRCHRGLVSDWFKVRGHDVLHILARGKTDPHPFTSAARVEGGQLFYGPAPELELNLGATR